ncbi:MAG: hypothetical protein EPO07_10675 [Verrucomicrobia bacterium]|nr:MAG: hypothetical protein EPO07_10675 [Verrucomicrobiota bacterium]
MSTPQRTSGVVIHVGSDRVVVGEDSVVIEAAEAMDWPVREFCRVPVFFEGRKFYVRKATPAAAPFKKRYELCPWPAAPCEESNRCVNYDATYVAERDELAKTQRRFDRVHFWLLPFYPLLGFCWSGFKNRVLLRIGFEPRSITSWSLRLEFALLMAEGIFVGWLRGGLLVWWLGHGRWRDVDLALTALAAADIALRWSREQNWDVQAHWGFCEWLWPGRRRRK